VTTNRTFEDPKKTDMRERVRIAVEASGMVLIEPPDKIAPPADAGIKGYIVGDLQALDSENVVHVFCLQLRGDKAIPQWLASWARAAHGLAKVRVHTVVEERTAILERSCVAAGAGLLELATDVDYQLRTIVDGQAYSPEATAAETKARLKDLRRRVITKMDANLETLKTGRAKISEHAQGLSSVNQEKYLQANESEQRSWRDWGDNLGQLLDEAAAEPSEALLARIEEELERGVPA
jgi:hypothetical protein